MRKNRNAEISLMLCLPRLRLDCLGKDEISKSATGSIDLRICYIPYVCQTKNLFPGKYDRDK